MTLIAGTREALLNEGDLEGPHGFTWGFVALEYYALIANRVLAVLATPWDLVFVRAGGLVAAPRSVTDAWYNPYAYLEERVLSRYAPIDVGSEELLKVDRANRRIPWKTITAVTFVRNRKWGMGTVPYSGRVFADTQDKRHELILLGDQNGEDIADKLRLEIAAALRATPRSA